MTRFEDETSRPGTWENITRPLWPLWSTNGGRLECSDPSWRHIKRDVSYDKFTSMHVIDEQNKASLAGCDTWRFYT